MSCAATPGFAQSEQSGTASVATPAEARSDDAAAGEIVVTGSRIRRRDLENTSPTAVLSEEAFAQKGVINVQDAINELPQLGIGQGNRTQNQDQVNSSYGAGGDYLNLRNLGIQRTLVIVNNRRFIGGDPGTSAVDLNAIPSILVNRIDVVTGAASAVYGADAVSGVVNVVLKEDFEGAELQGQAGISNYGDAGEYQVAGIIGGKFADGRGAALVAGQYTTQDGFQGKDRPFGQNDPNNFMITPLGGSTAVPNEVITNNGRNYTFDANNNLVLTSTLPTSITRYQRLPRRSLALPIDRTSIAATARYDLVERSDGGFSATVYAEGLYSRTDSYVFNEDRAVFFNGSPLLFTPLDSSLNQIRVPANNPYARALVPVIGPIPAAGLSVISRFPELGQVGTDIRRDIWRIVGGVRGDLTGSFTYDVYYQYGDLQVKQRDVNVFNRARFAETLNVNDNGTPLNFADDTCANAVARSQGCVPFNFFGQPTGQNEPVKAYIADPSGVDTEANQTVVSGFVSGELFRLPGGPVSLVMGGEYRREEATITPSSTYRDYTNGIRFQQGLPTSSYDVTEAFGELSLPLLRDLDFAHRLEVGGAVRYSSYSTVGDKISWSVRADYAPIPEIRFRGVYSTAIRAPNLIELYAPSTGVIAILQDPCDTVAENGTPTPPAGTRAASCQADIGAGAGSFNQSQIQSQSVVAVTSGNAALDAEKAKTYTAGVVLSPGGVLRGLNLTVDYYNIEIDDVLSTLALQDAVNQCYDQATRPQNLCGLISRDPVTRQITTVTNQTFNAATETVEGLDARLTLRLPLDRLSASLPGTFDLSMGWSHLFRHDFVARAGATTDKRAGQVGDFDNRYDIGAFYAVDGFSVSWQTRIYDNAVADTTIPATSPLAPLNRVPSVAYSDAQFGFDVGERFNLRFGAKNVFDKKPPVITPPARTVLGVQPTVGSIYDTRGRFFYVSAAIKY